jgi:hypothetical protein
MRSSKAPLTHTIYWDQGGEGREGEQRVLTIVRLQLPLGSSDAHHLLGLGGEGREGEQRVLTIVCLQLPLGSSDAHHLLGSGGRGQRGGAAGTDHSLSAAAARLLGRTPSTGIRGERAEGEQRVLTIVCLQLLHAVVHSGRARWRCLRRATCRLRAPHGHHLLHQYCLLHPLHCLHLLWTPDLHLVMRCRLFINIHEFLKLSLRSSMVERSVRSACNRGS